MAEIVKALLIDFNAKTGKRAADINPRDPKLPCHGWQDLESTPAREIRLVEDGRDLSSYKGVPGVIILENADAINLAIDELVPERYQVVNEALMLEHLRQEDIKLRDYKGQDINSILKDLYGQGIVGITRRKPEHVIR